MEKTAGGYATHLKLTTTLGKREYKKRKYRDYGKQKTAGLGGMFTRAGGAIRRGFRKAIAPRPKTIGLLRGAGTGAALGAAGGAAIGAARAEPGSRLQGAARGATIGAGVGAGGGLLARKVLNPGIMKRHAIQHGYA